MLFNAVIAVALGGGLFSTVAHGLPARAPKVIQPQGQVFNGNQNANSVGAAGDVGLGQGAIGSQFQQDGSFNSQARKPTITQKQDSVINQNANALESGGKADTNQVARYGQTSYGDILNDSQRPTAVGVQTQKNNVDATAFISGTGRDASAFQDTRGAQEQSMTVNQANGNRAPSTITQKQNSDINQDATILNSGGIAVVDQYLMGQQRQDSKTI